MQPYKNIIANAAPLDIPNVDTDQIIPKQFLKRVERSGFGQFLFFDWRFLDKDSEGADENPKENPDFILNQEPYKTAKILFARDNFGCGSSREHAPWALLDFGFEVIVAPSFADIFYNNCFQNGILPIRLEEEKVEDLFQEVAENPQAKYEIDLANQKIVSLDFDKVYTFAIDEGKKNKLLKGLDDIGWTLQFSQEIKNYQENSRVKYLA